MPTIWPACPGKHDSEKRIPAFGKDHAQTITKPRGNDGRYRSHLVTTARTKPAATSAFVVCDGARPPPGIAPGFAGRFPDVPAADPHHRLPCRLSGVVFDLSVDAEQGADALYRAWQFQLPLVPRRV